LNSSCQYGPVPGLYTKAVPAPGFDTGFVYKTASIIRAGAAKLLRGALKRRLGVQAPQEQLERHRGVLEVLLQQVQVGAALAEPGDRQIDRAERLLAEPGHRRVRPVGGRLSVPGVPDARGELLQTQGDTDAIQRLRPQPLGGLAEGADQPPQPDLGAERTHVLDNLTRTDVR